MNEEANKLLMMFINDTYRSHTGKISKRTALATMRFVENEKGLQHKVNIGDEKAILSHNIATQPDSD